MLERLTIDGMEINTNHITVLDVYCSRRAKIALEGGRAPFNMFDYLSQIIIGHQGRMTPVLLPGFELAERNEFYGVEGQHFPITALRDLFLRVFQDTDLPLPLHSPDEPKTEKRDLLRFASYPGQNAIDLQIDFPPRVALDLTQKLRDYLPAELLKQVTPHYRAPALTGV